MDLARSRLARIEPRLESAFRGCGLTVTMKTTLASFPGSTHWHVKKERRRGTLEITFWPSQRRLWFSMQDGRKGEWVMEAALDLKRKLENARS